MTGLLMVTGRLPIARSAHGWRLARGQRVAASAHTADRRAAHPAALGTEVVIDDPSSAVDRFRPTP